MGETAHIGISGLAVMGRNLARNLARNGYSAALHNRSAHRTRELIDNFGSEGHFLPTYSTKEFVAALSRPRRIIIMVKAGEPTDAVIDELIPLLDNGDVVIDAGNAHFADTRRREAKLREHGLEFVGTGVSGGEEGALHGPSIMPGGTTKAYEMVGPILEKIAATVDSVPCCTHIGADGAGHFVKMVHNGIEYADMQLIAETYDMLRTGLQYSPHDIADIFTEWNAGRLNSYLIEITAEILAHKDPHSDNPFIDVISDQAEQKGTGRWTVHIGLDLGSAIAGIAEAVFSRTLSGNSELREAGQQLPGPPPHKLSPKQRNALVDDIEKALYASKTVSYAQGFALIQAGSKEYRWNIDLSEIAAIWRDGCIIRAKFLDVIRQAFSQQPHLQTLLAADEFDSTIADAQEAWRNVVATATRLGIPVPGISSALSYYDSLRAHRLPANLIQAQRDFFGAHTYQRIDREGTFHTHWSETNRPEESV